MLRPLPFASPACGLHLSVAGRVLIARLLRQDGFHVQDDLDLITDEHAAGLDHLIHLVLNGAALAIQLYVTPRLQGKAGLQGSLLVLPTALLGGATMLLASASVVSRGLLRVTEGGLRSSIHRVSWEQAYLPLRRAQRVSAKLLGDGAGRVAEGLAALVLFLWLQLVVAGRPLPGQRTAWVTYLMLGTSMLWLGLTRALGRELAALTPRGELRQVWTPEIPLPDG